MSAIEPSPDKTVTRSVAVLPPTWSREGGDIRSVQQLLGHESLETTMIYTHVARQGPAGVTSPLDLLGEIAAEDVQAALVVEAGPRLP